MLKRAVDVVLGGALALLATPVIVVLAVMVWVSSRSFPFFVQPRLGLQHKAFRLVKLRTLPPETPTTADKYAIRELPLGRFPRTLRRLHLDELPQLFLVPLGKMSLVGPRPEIPDLADRWGASFIEARVQLRPGCTGLWQVSVADERLIGEAPEYDLFYVANANFRLDCWILWRTVLRFFGARVDLTDVPPVTLPRRDARTPVSASHPYPQLRGVP